MRARADMSRIVLTSLICALAVALVASLTYTAAVWTKEGRVSTGGIALALVTGISFVFLATIYRHEARPAGTRPNCFNCGRRVFLTIRSLDRREMLTCFSCGSEWVLPMVGADGAYLRQRAVLAPRH